MYLCKYVHTLSEFLYYIFPNIVLRTKKRMKEFLDQHLSALLEINLAGRNMIIRAVNPYEKVAILTPNFSSFFLIRLKTRSRFPHFFFIHPTI